MRTGPPSLNRRITGTAVAVLVISLVIGLIPQPPETGAHTRTKAGTIGQKITYAWGRSVKYPSCLREGPLYPSGWGCLQWVTKTRLENCPGPGPGCSVINTYIRLTCSGYWVGSSCREAVRHQHPTTTTRPTTTTTLTNITSPPTTARPARPPITVRPARPTRPAPTTTTTRPARPRPTRPPRPAPTTTTTTTRPPRPNRCVPLSERDWDVARGNFGWGSVLERPQGVTSGVAGGDEIPVGKESAQLFVTSNKLVESAAAEPRIWPLIPEGITMVSRGAMGDIGTKADCLWKLRSVRSEWRELLAWRAADRAGLKRAAPEFVEQWERMGKAQRTAVRARHRASGVENPEDVVCEVGQTAQTDCGFFVSHPSVWEWKLWATFRTETGEPPQERTLLVKRGVSRLQRLVDYTSSTAKVCAGGDC